MLKGVTDKGIEMMLAGDIEHVVDSVLPGPAPASRCVLADVVRVRESIVGKFVGQAVLTVGACTHPVVELALPGEALDGLYPQVAGHGQTVAVAVVVTTAGIDHRSNRIAGVRVKSPDSAARQPVVPCVRSVRLVDGNHGISRHHVVDIVPIVVACTDTAMLVRAVSEILAERDNIKVTLAPDHMVGIKMHSQTLVVGSHRLSEDTFLVSVADTHGEFRDVSTSDDVHGVVLVGSILVADAIQPVRSDE